MLRRALRLSKRVNITLTDIYRGVKIEIHGASTNRAPCILITCIKFFLLYHAAKSENKEEIVLKKYEFTGETQVLGDGVVLHRIRALRDMAHAKKGDLGGWIEKEYNLSHDGDAWVLEDAQVLDNAKVSGNAWLHGNARVYGGEIWGDARVYDGEFGGSIAAEGV